MAGKPDHPLLVCNFAPPDMVRGSLEHMPSEDYIVGGGELSLRPPQRALHRAALEHGVGLGGYPWG